MKQTIKKCKKNFIDYMSRTLKNKLCALIFIIIGLASNYIDQDGTFLLLTILIGWFLFFTKENIFSVEN